MHKQQLELRLIISDVCAQVQGSTMSRQSMDRGMGGNHRNVTSSESHKTDEEIKIQYRINYSYTMCHMHGVSSMYIYSGQ